MAEHEKCNNPQCARLQRDVDNLNAACDLHELGAKEVRTAAIDACIAVIRPWADDAIAVAKSPGASDDLMKAMLLSLMLGNFISNMEKLKP